MRKHKGAQDERVNETPPGQAPGKTHMAPGPLAPSGAGQERERDADDRGRVRRASRDPDEEPDIARRGDAHACRGSERGLAGDARPGPPGSSALPPLSLHALPLLFHRQLDNNHISCIEDGAFRALRDLEIL